MVNTIINLLSSNDMCSKKIAVLIPSYMPGDYIYDCLNSLQSQSLGKEFFKVYICLNGKKHHYYDFLVSILGSYSFDVELLYTEIKGVSNARNKLLDNSIEPYLVFIDDDDKISYNFLESLFLLIEKNTVILSNVHSGSSATGYSPNYIGNKFLEISCLSNLSTFGYRQFMSSSCAKLIPRSIASKYKFDIDIARGEDSLYMAKLSPYIKKVVFTPLDCIYFVYSREGSASRVKIKLYDDFFWLLKVLSRYLRLLLNSKYSTLFIFSRIAAVVFLFFKRNFFH